jgi:hypothetical protein
VVFPNPKFEEEPGNFPEASFAWNSANEFDVPGRVSVSQSTRAFFDEFTAMTTTLKEWAMPPLS